MELKQALVLRADAGMSKGKMAAQASHASLLAYLDGVNKDPDTTREWLEGQMGKIALKVNSEKELLDVYNAAKRAKLPCALVRDAGHTQVEPGTLTAVGIGPAHQNQLDKITGTLKLL